MLSPKIYSISQLNQETRLLLEGHFQMLWVRGELSNLSKPSSGHFYFSLKDASAQIRCAMFRNSNQNLTFTPQEGMEIIAKGRVSLYEARGDFQFILDYMEPSGEGALRQAFEALKNKFTAEGLFDVKQKKSLPKFPRCIGIITSPTGAAIRDIIITLRRRFPSIPVIIYPTEVQGKNAAPKIVKALAIANQRNECDVLILARGGGSLEDLWAFNEESVVRAIVASNLPIVTGIGHEVDISLADFVADHRAATPTAAAESITPNSLDYLQSLEQIAIRLLRITKQWMTQQQELLGHLSKRLRHPQFHLREQMQKLDHLEQKLITHYKHTLFKLQDKLKRLTEALLQQHPKQKLALFSHQIQRANDRLTWLMTQHTQRCQAHLTQLAATLHAVSPLTTLERGYAIAQKPDGEIIRTTQQLSLGEKIELLLKSAKVICEVIEFKN